MSSSYEDLLYEDFCYNFDVLRKFLGQKIKHTYELGYHPMLAAKHTVNARVLHHLNLVLGHGYFGKRPNKDLIKSLESMETLVKKWAQDGGEEKPQRREFEKMVEKMERANLKGWSSGRSWGFRNR